MNVNGIVLAAGYGKRLMPLTGHLPKPLLPVCGTPIIETALKTLVSAGVSKMAVNVHHLSHKIESFIEQSPFKGRVQLYREAEILGTGGPLVNARDLLSEGDCFLLHNGDVLCDFDLKRLLRQHLESGAIATMAAIDGPENRLLVSNGKVVDILGKLGVKAPADAKILTYACVAAFSPEIFKYLPEQPVFCSLIDAVLKAMAERPGSVSAFTPAKPFWCDIGSFEQYFNIHEKLLAERQTSFGAHCHVEPDARLSGFVSASENCVIASGARVCNCILLPGAHVPAGEHRRNEVIGPDFSVHRDQAALSKLELLSGLKDWEATSLVEQGSDRRFYRIRQKDKPSIALMVSSERDLDFQRFLDIGAFFHRYDLRTPELYASNPSEYSVLMEDLGDATLYDLAMASKSQDEIERMYGAVVDELARFQVKGTKALEDTGFQIRLFDRSYLRWESSYFFENFIGGLCRLKPDEAVIAKELDSIADDSFALPRTLMHRDFQSQNILLPKGVVRFVDFQGARLGPYTYDIASLLKDPYVNLPKAMRDRLLRRHYDALKGQGGLFKDLTFERYLADYTLASLQRNMQALGAYGFLSLKKRKAKYLAYATPCLALLREGLSETQANSLTSLKALCNEAAQALSSGVEAAKITLQRQMGT